MKKIERVLTQAATVTSGLVLAGCAQVGQGMSQLGNTIKQMGIQTPTVDAGTVTTAGSQAYGAVTAKPAAETRSAAEICAGVAGEIGARTSNTIYLKGKDGKQTSLSFTFPTGRFHLGSTPNNATGMAACVKAVTGVDIPKSCQDAKALVFPGVTGQTPAFRGYTKAEFGRASSKVVAYMPNPDGGVTSLAYSSRPVDRSKCNEALQSGR